jgi:cytochrome d ubiquinol oxidase subunit I
MSASTHSVGYMAFSLIGFVTLYTVFIAIEMYLMVRTIRRGPDDDHAGALPHDRLHADRLAGYAEG